MQAAGHHHCYLRSFNFSPLFLRAYAVLSINNLICLFNANYLMSFFCLQVHLSPLYDCCMAR